MAIVLTDRSDLGCCGGPLYPSARAARYDDRDASIRGLYGLSGPRPGDSDYIAPLAPRTATAATVESHPVQSEDNTSTYVAIGVVALIAAGIYFWTR